jgi:ABC-type polysaccharide/polyol phosphate export permease
MRLTVSAASPESRKTWIQGPAAPSGVAVLRFARSLATHTDLVYMLTWRDIKVKYKQSIMGFLWALLMPLLIIAAGVVVRAGLAAVSGRPMAASEVMTVALKALPWSFFVASIRFSTVSLSSNAHLVTKIAFPRSVFPVSAVLSQLFDAVIASGFVIVVLAVGGVGVTWHLLWVPVLLTLLVLLTTGLALFLSAANLFFRDVKYIVEVGLTFAIFFTPVFWDADLFGRWRTLVMLNPVAPILEGLKACVIDHASPDPVWTLYSAAIALAVSLAAPSVFLQLEPRFAESI